MNIFGEYNLNFMEPDQSSYITTISDEDTSLEDMSSDYNKFSQHEEYEYRGEIIGNKYLLIHIIGLHGFNSPNTQPLMVVLYPFVALLMVQFSSYLLSFM